MKKLLLIIIVSLAGAGAVQATELSKVQYTNAYCTGYVQSFSETHKYGSPQLEAQSAMQFFYNNTAIDGTLNDNGGSDTEALDRAFQSGYNDYTAATDKTILMPKQCGALYFPYLQNLYNKAKEY